MSGIDYTAITIGTLADQVVQDAVAAVKAHPEYQRAIESLSAAALNELLTAINVGV